MGVRRNFSEGEYYRGTKFVIKYVTLEGDPRRCDSLWQRGGRTCRRACDV